MNDLKNKKYISSILDKTNPTKPHVFCLTTNSRYILRENMDCDRLVLNRLYKEKTRHKVFINHLLFIFDVYLYFLSRKEKMSTLNFATQQDLIGYDFLPKELPDAYIMTKTKYRIDKYFLDLFDDYRKPAGIARFCLRKYIEFCENGDWQANTNNSPFPSLLFIVSDEKRKKHLQHYGEYKLGKTFEDISLFLTTQDSLRHSQDKINIWKRVR
jgi:hypothetical protein